MKDVEKIASLARLALDEAEMTAYQEQLSTILDHATMLNELDLSGIEPTAHAVAQQNILREDIVEPSMALVDVLFNAARHQQDQFLIQSVLET
jgi:aspartyl-tRNA(Asn)/glutamyl-tRNA(Gln) amidotransferase subunit C